uniref:LIM and SH3 domain protein n=1 Tax=Paulinella micropora TaxID=1928728 RepID=A0A2Z6ERX1_9EUKA|nr:LIM and SH3 domain protein [Paulinella micropora]
MSKVCPKCNKTVYPTEEIQGAGNFWHKPCFRCMGDTDNGQKCNITLELKTVFAHQGKIYCQRHVPKPKATVVTDDVMMEHARHAPHKGSEGLGHVGLIHKDARVQDKLRVDAATSGSGHAAAKPVE